MKHSISKFLIIGALSLGFTNNVLAGPEELNKDIKENIEKSILNTVKIQHDKGFLSEKSKINFTYLKAKDPDNKQSHASMSEVSENHFARLQGECKVEIALDSKGDSPHLMAPNFSEPLLEVTQFQNETQKAMARDFVTLHESFHCEFSGIKNPVMVANKGKFFHDEINLLLKDQSTSAGFQKLAYIRLLNENFADTAAAMAMIKQYGVDNKDLNHVLKIMEAERHGSYFQYHTDDHFSHFSLETVLNKSVQQRILDVKDGASFNDLALRIANMSSQKVMSYRPYLVEGMTSEAQLGFSIHVQIVYLIRSQFLSEEGKKNIQMNPWKDGIDRGMAYEIASRTIGKQDFTSIKLFNLDGSDGKEHDQLMNVVGKLMGNLKIDSSQLLSYLKAQERLNEFKAAVIKPVDTDSLDFIPDVITKGEVVVDKIKVLRERFVNSEEASSNIKLAVK